MSLFTGIECVTQCCSEEYFVFRMSLVQILAQRSETMSEVSVISSALLGKCWDSMLNEAITASYYILTNSLFTDHPTICLL
jgi:hypothetical protein